MNSTSVIRTFLSLESLSFFAAATVHFGLTLTGYEHQKAGIAETVIGCVLLAGLVFSLLRSSQTRRVGLYAQGFALFGACIGLFTIAVGVGPQTAPDLAYHVFIIVVLVSGLIVAWKRH